MNRTITLDRRRFPKTLLTQIIDRFNGHGRGNITLSENRSENLFVITFNFGIEENNLLLNVFRELREELNEISKNLREDQN